MAMDALTNKPLAESKSIVSLVQSPVSFHWNTTELTPLGSVTFAVIFMTPFGSISSVELGIRFIAVTLGPVDLSTLTVKFEAAKTAWDSLSRTLQFHKYAPSAM